MKQLLGTWGAIFILMLGLAGCAQDDGSTEAEGDAAAGAPTATASDQAFDNTENDDQTDETAELHDPIVMVMTNTPPPVTNTPEPTVTPEPTAVPPTNTPVPIQPTSPPPPPPPPPTAVPPTAEPPPPPPPIGANGLVASHFAVQERSDLKVEGRVWFEFVITNSTGGEVSYYSLGVMPRKDGNDRPEWYQQSYGGPNASIKAEGLTWEDNIKMKEAGDYTLRMVICFDSYDSCSTGSGSYQSLSGEIPITISN